MRRFLSIALRILYCAWKHVISRISECIPRIRHCFSTNGPGKEKQWPLALERAWWHSYYCTISLCKLSPSNRRNFKKFIHWRKSAQDARYSRMQILTMKERLEERSASMSLEIAFFFHKLYITESFQTLKTFLPLDFFKRCFKKTFASSNRKIHRESMKWRARLVPAQA